MEEALIDYKPLTLNIPTIPPLGVNMSVFNEDKTIKPLTFEQQLNSGSGSGLDVPVFSTSINDVIRYQDPFIEYKPGVDIEELYANAHSFTWGDSFGKMWKTLKIHTGSSFSNFGSALKGLANGDTSALYDNKYLDHMATLTENLETQIPQYKTRYERENPFAFSNWDSTLKSILPSAGTALGGVVDMLLGHTIMTATGGIAGNALQFGRDAQVLKNIFSTGYSVSKNLNTAKNIKNIQSAAQMTGTALFYANSEAALQAKLNENKFLESERQKYFSKFGVMPNGEALADIENRAGKLARDTYVTNVALISLSSMQQFPGLLSGKLMSNRAKNLAIDFTKEGAKRKNLFTHFAKEGLKDSTAEGLEEYFQGVIDSATTDYYSGTRNRNKLETFFNSSIERLNTEGLLEFAGGFIIGGGMNLGGTAIQALPTIEKTNNVITTYNKSTANLLKNFTSSQVNFEKMGSSKDPITFESALSNEIANKARTDVNNGTVTPSKEYLLDLKEMPIEQFNKYTNQNFSEQERFELIDETLNQYNKATNIYEGINAKYAINPFTQNQKWNNIINKLTDITPISKDLTLDDDQKAFKENSQIVWEELKNILALNAYKDEHISDKIKQLGLPEELDKFLDPNIGQVIVDYKKELRNLPDVDGLPSPKKILEKFEGKNIVEQYKILLKEIGIDEGIATEILNLKAAKSLFETEFNTLQSQAGLLAKAEEIVDFIKFKNYVAPKDIAVKPVETTVAKDVDGNIIYEGENAADIQKQYDEQIKSNEETKTKGSESNQEQKETDNQNNSNIVGTQIDFPKREAPYKPSNGNLFFDEDFKIIGNLYNSKTGTLRGYSLLDSNVEYTARPTNKVVEIPIEEAKVIIDNLGLPNTIKEQVYDKLGIPTLSELELYLEQNPTVDRKQLELLINNSRIKIEC